MPKITREELLSSSGSVEFNKEELKEFLDYLMDNDYESEPCYVTMECLGTSDWHLSSIGRIDELANREDFGKDIESFDLELRDDGTFIISGV